MNDILIVKAPYIFSKKAMKEFHDKVLKEMETGLVVLPAGFSVALCPKDVEVQFMDSNNDIFKEEKDGT